MHWYIDEGMDEMEFTEGTFGLQRVLCLTRKLIFGRWSAESNVLDLMYVFCQCPKSSSFLISGHVVLSAEYQQVGTIIHHPT